MVGKRDNVAWEFALFQAFPNWLACLGEWNLQVVGDSEFKIMKNIYI